MDEQETVYVLKPKPLRSVGPDGRLRQRVKARFEGAEPDSSIEHRVKQYLHGREIIESVAQSLVDEQLQNVMGGLEHFISDTQHNDQLPVSMLTQASNKVVVERLKEQPGIAMVQIRSKECPNLKSALKLVVNRFTNREKLDDIPVDRRLTYDFGILNDWLQPETTKKLVVYIEDTECFDVAILDGLMHYMTIYLNCLPFHLVLSLTTSPKLVMETVSQSTLSNISACAFNMSADTSKYLAAVRAKLAEIDINVGEDLIQELTPLRFDRAAQALKYAVLAKSCGGSNPKQINDIALHRTVFAPTQRPALETALAVPAYFGGDQSAIPLAVLYQIYRESSMYINIFDFYTEFRAHINKPETVDESLWEKQALAWFLEGIAELKLMGVLRDCKRKFECVEKVSWMGV